MVSCYYGRGDTGTTRDHGYTVTIHHSQFHMWPFHLFVFLSLVLSSIHSSFSMWPPSLRIDEGPSCKKTESLGSLHSWRKEGARRKERDLSKVSHEAEQLQNRYQIARINIFPSRAPKCWGSKTEIKVLQANSLSQGCLQASWGLGWVWGKRKSSRRGKNIYEKKWPIDKSTELS